MFNILTDNTYNHLRFKWLGDGSSEMDNLINQIKIRDTSNFNWTFIFLIAVVFFLYGYNIYKKNWRVVKAGLALYSVHWLYEIANAIINKVTGNPLWAVSNDSTTFVLLIGVSWELSMMFSLAGMITFMMLPKDPNARWFSIKDKENSNEETTVYKFKGIPAKLVVAIGMALFFALFEAFLAATNDGKTFMWYYPWWGVPLVFITTYVPFFLAAVYVPDMKGKRSNIFLAASWGLVVLLLAILIPCQVI